MHVIIRKRERTLCLMKQAQIILRAAVGLGRSPVGPKRREGDGKTPEGIYALCLVKPCGKYGRSLGLSYPNLNDAKAALEDGRIAPAAFHAISDALAAHQRPPWGTALGGEIYIHEGGAHADWTQGCIALNAEDMDVLFAHHTQITRVEIHP